MTRKSKLSQKILASKKWWKTVEMEDELENIETELDEEYKKKKMKAENDAIKKIKKYPKYFFNYAKKSSKSPNQIGPFIEKDGTIVSDPFEKAEKLRKQYESVYSKPDEKWIIPDVDIFFSVSGQEQESCLECQGERVHRSSRIPLTRHLRKLKVSSSTSWMSPWPSTTSLVEQPQDQMAPPPVFSKRQKSILQE